MHFISLQSPNKRGGVICAWLWRWCPIVLFYFIRKLKKEEEGVKKKTYDHDRHHFHSPFPALCFVDLIEMRCEWVMQIEKMHNCTYNTFVRCTLHLIHTSNQIISFVLIEMEWNGMKWIGLNVIRQSKNVKWEEVGLNVTESRINSSSTFQSFVFHLSCYVCLWFICFGSLQ